MYCTRLINEKDVAIFLGTNSRESILSPEEMGIYINLSSLRRKEEWLRGRIAAKWLLSDLLKSSFVMKVPFNNISILNDSYGKPYINLKENFQDINFLHLSITHQGTYAASAISIDMRVGIDLSLIRPISPSMQSYFLNQKEIAEAIYYFGEINGPILLWTIKEAYLKALGIGMRRSMKSFEIEIAPITDESPRLTISSGNNLPIPTMIHYHKIDNLFISMVLVPV